MSHSRVALLPLLSLVAALGGAPARALAGAIPAGWPSHLAIGMADVEGGAADLRTSTPLEARYHYLRAA